jgi:hypothetical protein
MSSQLSIDDRDRLRAAILDRGEIRAQLALQWVQNLSRVANELAAKGKATSADSQTVFWIRLFGVLVEIGESYEYLCNVIGSVDRDAVAVRDAIREARAALDEDERLWVHYQRDVECHVWQESYELGVGGKGKLKEQRYFALLGKTLHVDEIDKRSRALIRKYNVDDPVMAVAFGTKLAPRITKILNAMLPLY